MVDVRVTCLASGSSGNALLVQTEERALLVDAGLSARKLTAALRERGLDPSSLEAILITHEHSDHTSGVRLLSKRFGVPVVANSATIAEIRAYAELSDCRELRTGETTSLGTFEATSFPVSHDAVEPVGYVLEVCGYRISVFTDLGCLKTRTTLTAMSRSDLIVLEANHDTDRLMMGPYPMYLKRRILSDTGHLSNLQTAEIIGEAISNRPQTFWLAHLSRNNNTKRLAKEMVLAHLGKLGLAPDVLVTDRDKPSLVWEPPRSSVQLSIFGARDE